MVMRSATVDFAPRGISCVLWIRPDQDCIDDTGAPLSAHVLIQTLRPKSNPENSFNYDGRKYLVTPSANGPAAAQAAIIATLPASS